MLSQDGVLVCFAFAALLGAFSIATVNIYYGYIHGPTGSLVQWQIYGFNHFLGYAVETQKNSLIPKKRVLSTFQ